MARLPWLMIFRRNFCLRWYDVSTATTFLCGLMVLRSTFSSTAGATSSATWLGLLYHKYDFSDGGIPSDQYAPAFFFYECSDSNFYCNIHQLDDLGANFSWFDCGGIDEPSDLSATSEYDQPASRSILRILSAYVNHRCCKEHIKIVLRTGLKMFWSNATIPLMKPNERTSQSLNAA